MIVYLHWNVDVQISVHQETIQPNNYHNERNL